MAACAPNRKIADGSPPPHSMTTTTDEIYGNFNPQRTHLTRFHLPGFTTLHPFPADHSADRRARA